MYEFEQPLKKPRYNLRQTKNRIQRAASNEVLGAHNIKNNKNIKNKIVNKKTMEIDSDESCDEDIDLIQCNNNNKKHNKVLLPVPLRRSVRLANKRKKKQQQQREEEEEKEEEEEEEVFKYIEDDEANKLLDCDTIHIDDDLYVIDYISDITDWYYECENLQFENNLIRNNYISTKFQSDLNEKMRCVLLNWLLNVHRRFQLLDSTLFLGIYIFDAYLSKTQIKRDKLQLIGCSSMLIAAKYHEIYAPEGNDFSYISDHAFDTDTLFNQELKILTKLQFKFANIITPFNFIQRYLQIVTYPLWKKYEQRNTKKAKKDREKYINLVKELTFYFAELSLFDIKLISTAKPSLIAAASICFAILGISLYSQWPDFMKKNTKYSYQQLKPVLKRLNDFRKISNSRFPSIRKKHKGIEQWIDKLNIQHAINNNN